MGKLRLWLRRLERDTKGATISIPQADGSVARFEPGVGEECFLHEANRLRKIHRGEDPGDPHPLIVAKRNALHPEPGFFDADRQPRRDAG
ncbi:MAG TPA: hypothetical protein VNA27_14435 [Rubrobacteraceae bacterium]|nr:hypothetical protein [Rubrobacteraceae bacterium]